MRDPVTWEAVLLVVDSLLQVSGDTAAVALEVAIAALLTFECSSRPSDWLQASTASLRPPLRGQPGTAQYWNITLYPSAEDKMSKTKQQDDSVTLGEVNVRRAWLAQVVAALKQHRGSRASLFSVSLREFETMLKTHAALAGVAHFVPHQLRHGGASADSAAGISETIIQQRGNWATAKAMARYRKPGRYIYQLGLLSRAQLTRAAAVESSLARRLISRLSTRVRQGKRSVGKRRPQSSP